MTFWEEALPYVDQVHTATGVLNSVLLAQSADETNYGVSTDLTIDHNWANVSPNGEGVYATLQAGCDAWIETMNNGDYQAVKSASSWQTQCEALGQSPWAASHYEGQGVYAYPGGVLMEIIQENDLTQYDTLVPVPTPPSPPPLPPPLEEGEMEFIAKSPDGSAMFLYDIQTKTRKGISQAANVTGLEAVGIKNYAATLSTSFLSEFTLEANWD